MTGLDRLYSRAILIFLAFQVTLVRRCALCLGVLLLVVLCRFDLLEVGRQERLQNFIYFRLVTAIVGIGRYQISFLEQVNNLVDEVI